MKLIVINYLKAFAENSYFLSKKKMNFSSSMRNSINRKEEIFKNPNLGQIFDNEYESKESNNNDLIL